jgi:prepilin-type N-terminal cleavage/methylation domain-containing protein
MQRRRGFTLLEMIVAMSVLALVLGLTVPFFRIGMLSFEKHAGRLDAQQNARYGISTIDRELRVAGVGVVDAQPLIVQAAANAITFNVDLVSQSPTDIAAAYYDPDAPDAEVIALGRSRRLTLPLSLFAYPDTDYTQQGGAPSAAETISFWVAPDPAPQPGFQGTQLLYRKVNNGTPVIIAQGLVLHPGESVFRYFKADTLGQPIEIPPGSLPIYHSAAIHNSRQDTLTSALTDSIRIVRVHLNAIYADRDGKIVERSAETGVRIMNAGLLHHSTCGEPPIFGSAVAASTSPDPLSVQLNWTRAFDESGGEKDVEMYAVYRRAPADPGFGEPLASIAAGAPNYSFTDTQVTSGEQWTYGVAAIDCSGQASSIVTTPLLTIP